MHQFLRTLLSRGLRSHLLLILAAILLPMGLFGLVAWLDRVVILRDAETEVERGVEGINQQVFGTFQASSLVIELVDQRIQNMTWNDVAGSNSVHDYLVKLVKENPELESVWIADASGVVRNASSVFPSPMSWTVGTDDLFIGARASDKLLFGTRADDAFVNGPIDQHFYIAKRRTTADGHFEGIVELKVAASYFSNIWQQNSDNSPDVTTLLMNTNLTVLAHLHDRAAVVLDPGSRIGKAVKAGATAGLFHVPWPRDGIERIVAYRHVEPYDAYVTHSLSLPAALQTWYRHLAVYGGIFALAALGLVASAIMATTRMQRERIAVAQWREAVQDLAAETEQHRIVEKQLFEAEKLETLGQVAGGFAHDFGNVLMAIQLNLEHLKGRMRSDDDEGTLQNAITEVERGTEAVRSLLIFARHGSLEMQVVDPRAHIEEIKGLLRQAVGAHTAIEIESHGGPWLVQVNANQFELALLNLAVNARDAMTAEGKFRIAIDNLDLSGAPDGLLGEHVQISVSDTGCGMSPEILAKAVEPFFTTKEEGKGTGLGLSQVYGFAKQCGGAITLESEVGRGTCVTIYLPRLQPDSPLLREFKEEQIFGR